MPVAVTKVWSDGQVLSASDLNANFDDIEAYSASIPGTDIAAGTVPNSALQNDDYEIVLNMTVRGDEWTAHSDGDIVALAGLPCDVDATAYTILKVEYGVFDSTGGLAAGDTFDLEYGYFRTDTGAWTVVTQVNTAGAWALPVPGGAGATSGSWATAVNVATSVTQALTPAAPASQNVFALQRVANAGAGFMTADQFLTVSIKLRRTNGLR